LLTYRAAVAPWWGLMVAYVSIGVGAVVGAHGCLRIDRRWRGRALMSRYVSSSSDSPIPVQSGDGEWLDHRARWFRSTDRHTPELTDVRLEAAQGSKASSTILLARGWRVPASLAISDERWPPQGFLGIWRSEPLPDRKGTRQLRHGFPSLPISRRSNSAPNSYGCRGCRDAWSRTHDTVRTHRQSIVPRDPAWASHRRCHVGGRRCPCRKDLVLVGVTRRSDSHRRPQI
jgi:hypothetical protein